MSPRQRRPVADPAGRPFDDRRTSQAIGAMATAFVVGGLATWLAMGAARTARAQVAGPPDGAPLMRAPLQVVAPVDLQRYAGIWHEQARLPNRFQKSCSGPVTAEYTPQPDGTVQVVNRCVRADGNFNEAIGTARVVPVAGQPGAGRLEVRFAPAWLSWLPIVWGDYWILKLDRDYQVALVGTPDREYLWVLSRAPRLDDATLQVELDYARSLGFDADKVVLTGR
ncbi:apolipoprotein D and lipocalin family protein [Variovorax boronicumulans]|uniref:lipocalin family protein n=1 Tax=Variovorax TaxID=34072 RepID=UPI00277E04B7|nr:MULTISPECIES: lipocalin family protein [Variovorax]MDP9992474.1 apolipoprotein D and lipocalin family protein [Variovorax boronicumulans]MDQ0002354.1 apolipoprotein D and lipocalin family protein [Variovorax boronicumulans]MDQ0037238.1 apolipoprotein D and lipocalin family protein [Variovorax boronicumulans]MDQ0610341.1 apolipoprotein D and lipocalin family protein [Variovorax sp. W1I1]